MVLGFISLLLTFGQNYISAMCIPAKYADTMLPCPMKKKLHKEPAGHLPPPKGEDAEHHRRLLLWDGRRFLAADSEAKGCKHVSMDVCMYACLLSTRTTLSVKHLSTSQSAIFNCILQACS